MVYFYMRYWLERFYRCIKLYILLGLLLVFMVIVLEGFIVKILNVLMIGSRKNLILNWLGKIFFCC